MPKNIIITGVPRSGTSLLTSLLSQNTECVTFSEPDWLKTVRKGSPDAISFAQEFYKKINVLRNDIWQGVPVYIKESKFKSGVPDNYFHRTSNGQVIVDKQEVGVVFEKSFADALFIIKANAQFTACLNTLVGNPSTKILAIVRDPLAVLMSWRSLDIPVSHGKMLVAEKYHPTFSEYIRSESLLDKQILILDWFFKQYAQYQDHIKFIKYETLISNTAETMEGIIGAPLRELPVLKSKNRNKVYNENEKDLIAERLRLVGQYHQTHYPR